MSKICASCGAVCQDHEKFCSQCGTPLPEAAPVPEPQPVPLAEPAPEPQPMPFAEPAPELTPVLTIEPAVAPEPEPEEFPNMHTTPQLVIEPPVPEPVAPQQPPFTESAPQPAIPQQPAFTQQAPQQPVYPQAQQPYYPPQPTAPQQTVPPQPGYPQAQQPYPQQQYVQQPVYQQPYPPQQPYQQPAYSVAQKPLEMNWFKFVINFQLFASAVVYFINGVTSLIGLQYGDDRWWVYSNFPGLSVTDKLLGVLALGLAAFAIFTRFRLAQFRKKAYVLYLLFGGAGILYALLDVIFGAAILGPAFDSATLVSSVSGIITNVVMLILNFVYFKKRAHLFVN